MLASLQLLPDVVGVIDADHHQVPVVAQVECVASRLELVEHRLHAGAAGTGGNPGPHPAFDQDGGLAANAAAGVGVLADDDRVEVMRRDLPQLDDVLVPPIARGGHHPDPLAGDHRLPATGRRLAQAVHELAQRLHRRRVVRVVDDHPVAVELEHVEAPGRHEVAGGEGAQPLADVVEVRSCGPGRSGCGQGVLHVHASTTLEGGGEQVGPDQGQVLASLAQHDHLPVAARLDGDRPAPAARLPPHRLIVGVEAEIDHRSRAVAAHRCDQGIVGVEYRGAVARHRLDQHLLHRGQLAQRGDATHAQVVAGHVEHHRHVVAVVAEPFAQDPAARHLEDGQVDVRVLEHGRGGLGAAHVAPADQPAVDEDAIGAGHADLAAHAAHDVGDHPGGGGLAVAAGDRHDRDARRRPGREEHVDHRLGDVLRLAFGGVGVHAEARRRVDLNDPAAGLAHRDADIGADEVDARDVQPHHAGRQLGDVSVLRVDLLGPVDADAAGAHVAGALEEDARLGRRDAIHLESLLAGVARRLVVDRDAGEHLLMTDPAARIGVGLLHQLGEGVAAISVHVRRHAFRDRPHDPADHQAAVVVADQEALHHHAAVARLRPGNGVRGLHRGRIGQVEHHAAAVVAVQRLDHHREVDSPRCGDRLLDVAHHVRPRHRNAGPSEQRVGQLLVRRDVHAQRAGLRGHRGPDPLLVDAVAKLYQRLVVEPDPRHVAQARLVEDGLGRRSEGGSLGEADQLFELVGEVEGQIGLDQVVHQAHREPTGGEADALLRVREDDVVAPGLAGAARLAAPDLGAGAALQLEGNVLGHVAEPRPVAQPP